MNNDTKVGVLVGLVIVVVASGYFYGSGQDSGDIFVSPELNTTAVPQIPLSTDRKVALATPSNRDVAPTSSKRVGSFQNVGRHSIQESQSRGRSDNRNAATTPDTRLPEGFVVPEDRVTNGFRVPENRQRPAGSDRNGETRRAFAARPDLESGERPDRLMERATVAVTDHTALRSGAAVALTESIQENLRNADRPAPDFEVVVSEPPTESWPQQHELQEGETLYEIALLYYGSGRDVARLLRANPNIGDPKRIRPGLLITLPDPDLEPAEIKPARRSAGSQIAGIRRNAAPRTYEVREGDSFYTIAKHFYGDGRRWNAIYDLNKALVKDNPKRLRDGMIIKLPPAE